MSSWDLYRFARKNRKILNRIEGALTVMGEQFDAGMAELMKDLHRVADAYTGLQAQVAAQAGHISDLEAALQAADANQAAAVAAAHADDDVADASAVADADAILEQLDPEPALAPEPAPEG